MIQRRIACCLALIIVASATSSCNKKAKPSVDSFEWSSELRKEIVTVVQDEGRAEQMLAVVDDLEKSIFTLDAQTRDLGEAYAKLNQDYNASREDFDALASTYKLQLQQFAKEYSDTRDRLRSLLTREEWAKIADKEASLFETWNPGAG